MLDIRLRWVKDGLFEHLVPFVPLPVTPSHLTAIGLIFGLLACAAASVPQTAHLAVYLWLANRFFDCLDGVVARRRRLASDLGAFYDLFCDFLIYSAIPISVAYGQAADGQRDVPATRLWLGIAFAEATFHINNFVLFYCAAVASERQKGELTSITMKPALIEGFESGLIFSAMLIWRPYVGSLCWMMGGLVTIGIVQRFWYIRKVLSKPRQ